MRRLGLLCGMAAISVARVAAGEEVVAGEAAGAGERGELVWQEGWREFRAAEWAVMLGATGIFAFSKLGPQPSGHWRGSFWLDEGVRDALRVESASGREVTSLLSHVGLTVSMAWPFFDAGVVAGWQKRSPKVAWQQALISGEVLAITAALQGVVSTTVGRERPYGRECGFDEDGDSYACSTRYRYWSYYSAHASLSFAGATANCMHHAYVPLYGGGAGDLAACVGALGVAGTTAMLRVATDAHHFSDILVGALMGSATGLLVPWALHYRGGVEKNTASGEAGKAGEAGNSGAGGSFALVPEALGAGGLGARAIWVF